MVINKCRILLIALSAVLLTACLSMAGEPDRRKVKIINWNVLYGFNHKKSIKQGCEWLKRQKADVVALQELNGHDARSLKEMAGKWGHKHVAILKEQGFPVGLTSKLPIEVIERRIKGYHHGYLHCKTYDIHFIVVHFWPGKDHEAAEILGKIKPILDRKEKVVVLGDFNTHSKKDRDFLSERDLVKPLYDVVDGFEKAGFVDLVHKHDKKARFSFPSPITIPRWSKTMKEVEAKRQRIDFIFADRILQKSSASGTILKSKELDKISDHYPIVVVLK